MKKIVNKTKPHPIPPSPQKENPGKWKVWREKLVPEEETLSTGRKEIQKDDEPPILPFNYRVSQKKNRRCFASNFSAS